MASRLPFGRCASIGLERSLSEFYNILNAQADFRLDSDSKEAEDFILIQELAQNAASVELTRERLVDGECKTDQDRLDKFYPSFWRHDRSRSSMANVVHPYAPQLVSSEWVTEMMPTPRLVKMTFPSVFA